MCLGGGRKSEEEAWWRPSHCVSSPLHEGDWRAGFSPGPQASRLLPRLLLLTATCIVLHAMQRGSELLLRAAPWLGSGGSSWTPLWVTCARCLWGGGSDPVKSPSPENMGCGKAWRQPLPCYSSAPFAPCNPGHSSMWSVLLLSHFTE